MSLLSSEPIDPAALLAWHVAMGADEGVADAPLDRFNAPAPDTAVSPDTHSLPTAEKPAALASTGPTAIGPVPIGQKQTGPTPIAARPAKPTGGAGPDIAAQVAASCATVDELQAAISAFDGGLIKRSAKNTVFSDGTFGADLMVIGDVPGTQDDQEGLPFRGPAGDLLDKMLAAIGLDRTESAYLSNVLPWRLLGNSKPNEALLAVCKPFVERHIQLAQPKILLFMGGAAAKSLTGTADSISRQRGRWQNLTLGEQTFAALPTYHPTYLLNQPHQKRAAWADLLAVKERLSS